MTTPPPFRLAVVLASGRTHRFFQDDATKSVSNLARIRPEAFFTEPSLVIGGGHFAAAFRTAEILRIEVDATPRPKWAFGPRVSDARLISKKEFEVLAAKRADVEREERSVSDGQAFRGLARFEDSLGEEHYLEIDGEQAPRSLVRTFPARLLDVSVLHVHRGETDVLFNPVHISAIHVFPGPPELRSTALEAHREP